MSGFDELDRVERLLSSTPPPAPVPPAVADAARQAALGSGQDRIVVTAQGVRLPRPRWGRLVPAVAVMASAAAAALVIGVGGRGSGIDVQRSISLAGPGGANATVELGSPADGSRPVLVRVHDLRPAPAGFYYEMWFQVGDERVSAVTFNTDSSGGATIPTTLPSGMHWRRCWVTMEQMTGGHHDHVVLRSV
jgi:hypothetical protein